MKARQLLIVIASILLLTGFAAPLASAVQKKPVVKHSTAKKAKKPAKKKSTKKKSTKKTTKKAVPAKAPVGKVDPLNAAMVGTWYTLDADGKFAKANKFVFTKTGEFNYIGPGWKSGGTFNLRDGVVTLSWLQIDGQPVKPGTVKKQIPLAEKKFQIERFAYGKAPV
jgi:hypothetical protein